MECRVDANRVAEEFLDKYCDDAKSTKFPRRSRTITNLGKLIWKAFTKGEKSGREELRKHLIKHLKSEDRDDC